jgi:nicotinate-nucleotide adenylyltransferase
MKTAIFSGSFNPIHIGHLAVANWICEFCDVDELWFMVSPQNPLKNTSELIDETKRFEMVSEAIKGYPKFVASDFEFSMPRPSYTIDTLRALRLKYPERDFSLLMGADCWNGIRQWKEYGALMDEFPIIIYPRKDYDIIIPAKYSSSVTKTDAPLIEISSTFIRRAIAAGKDVRFFLPARS